MWLGHAADYYEWLIAQSWRHISVAATHQKGIASAKSPPHCAYAWITSGVMILDVASDMSLISTSTGSKRVVIARIRRTISACSAKSSGELLIAYWLPYPADQLITWPRNAEATNRLRKNRAYAQNRALLLDSLLALASTSFDTPRRSQERHPCFEICVKSRADLLRGS